MQLRSLDTWRRAWTRASSPLRADLRETGPGTVVGQCSGGWRTPGEHRRDGPSLAKARSSSERTPGGSKASKWACRPFTGEPDVRGSGRIRAAHLCVEAAGLATAGNLRPDSCVPGPSQDGRARQTSWLDRGKQPRKPRGPHAGGSRKRTHKEATARESGCGSPGRESSGGALQGRERHETRPRGVGEHTVQAVC